MLGLKFHEVLSKESLVVFCNCSVALSSFLEQRRAELSSSRSTGPSYRRAKWVLLPPEKPSTVKTRSMSDSDILSSLSSQLESPVKEMREFREESKREMREFQDIDVIDDLKVENSQLQRELDHVKQELCNVQKYSCRNTVNIQGVPENKSENVFEVVKAVAKVLRFDLKPEIIDAVHRLAGDSGSSRPRAFDACESNILSLEFDIVSLTETWLDESVYRSVLFTDEWSVWRSDGTDRVRGGGCRSRSGTVIGAPSHFRHS
ncbi:hypothetical protein J6590_104717 [Homalodisca vitripennis]|nr:hypothetical protein J6590_104717 [Homalodisca vitripennis]